jgi:hypothetical protein
MKSILTVLLLALSPLVLALDLAAERRQPPGEEDARLFHLEPEGDGFQITVQPGNPGEAATYYEKVRKNLGNFPVADLQKSRMQDMLQYFGYPSLSPDVLEKLSPAELEKLYPNDLVAVRFFAPKIVDVSGKENPAKLGWRKIIRLKARDGGPGAQGAQKDSLAFFYVLFNFATDRKEEPPAFPPPGTRAGQIQAMLVPIYPHQDKHFDSYFLVYNRLDGKCPDGACTPAGVGDHLTASFDLGGAPPPEQKYYVPRACAQCHGATGFEKKVKVNYLDTDHWLDRVQPGDDFPDVPKGNVLPDGTASFQSFRTMNEEVLAQNKQVDANGFAVLAVSKWLDLHPNGLGHAPLFERALKRPGTSTIWNKQNSVDAKLLPLLNRNCFRCHSSVSYHVFEKRAVVLRKDSMAKLLEEKPEKKMPQDRTLSPQTIQEMKTLLKELKP